MTETRVSRGLLLSEQVYNMIRASILDGSHAPGDRLVESEIARRLEVSQAPVREAIKRLVHDGLVTSVTRSGSYVTAVSQDELRMAREVRAALERIGARAAVAALSPENTASLRSIVDAMREAVTANDWARFRVLDMDFHRTVISIGGHQILGRMWAALEPLLLSQRAIGDPSYSGDRSVLIQWHLKLIELLAAGDPDVAGEAFFGHAYGVPPQDS